MEAFLMKKTLILITLLMFSLTLISCEKTEDKPEDPLSLSWEEIVENGKDSTVNLYYWGGSTATNNYFDEFVAINLKEKYDITLNTVPVSDIKDIVNKILLEKQNEQSDGSVDLLWINGENFKLMKDESLLYGDLTSILPNFNQYIKENPKDFTEDTNGLEVPFGKAQFVLVYNEDRMTEEINTLEDLTQWIKNNPGRFTYPSIPDFTGSAFIRHFYYNESSGIEKLEAINPYLWREGKTYPNSAGALDTLYSQGEVDFTMSYTPFHQIQKIRSGEFSDASKTLILEDGTLSNTHFLTIPFNAKEKAGALVAINYLISFEAQYEKMKPSVWGDLMVLKEEYLSKNEKEQVNTLIDDYQLDIEMFENNRLEEFSGDQIEAIEKEWIEKILE
jgi:putative spermidine/putrescine transport system substrate-binding protein